MGRTGVMYAIRQKISKERRTKTGGSMNMKRYYKFAIIAFVCLCFVFSMFIGGEAANVSNVSVSPNPFNPYPPDNQSTTISYALANSALLWLRIYDLDDNLKRKLAIPVNYYTQNKTGGSKSDVWNGRDDLNTIVLEAIYPFHIDDIAWISTSSDISSGLQYPHDVAVNPSNSSIIWVADSAGRLLKSADGGASWAQVLYGGSGAAYGIAISSDGQNIYVLESGNKRLYYSTDGGGAWNYYSLWASSSVPHDITCSGDGTVIYAVDSNTNIVYKSTDSGANWSSGVSPPGVTGSSALTGVAVDPNNSNIVLVVNRGGNKVYKSTDGGATFTTVLSSSGTGDGQLSGPYQVSIDNNGHYWVSERGNHRVQQFDSGNKWVMTVGGTGSGTGNYQFNTNSVSLGIFFASFSGQQYLYAADYLNKKIKRYAYDNHISAAHIIVSSDKIPPAAVTNLVATGIVGSNSAQLRWTAPGDDGSAGQASSYDVRYAKTPIADEAAFSAASQATGEPVPSPAGTTEYFTVTGLESNTTYYFALKTGDEALNTSGLSTTSPSGKTGLLSGWNMVSCPLQPSPSDSASVFGDDAGLNYMWYWNSTWTGAGNPDSAGYYVQAATIIPGKGIFLYSIMTNNPTDATGNEITEPFRTLSLEAGWNLIGNPYGTSVNLSSCTVTYNSVTKSYANAVTSGWIGNAVYIWNGSAYVSVIWDIAALEPWKGCWIFSYYDLDLIIYKP